MNEPISYGLGFRLTHEAMSSALGERKLRWTKRRREQWAELHRLFGVPIPRRYEMPSFELAVRYMAHLAEERKRRWSDG